MKRKYYVFAKPKVFIQIIQRYLISKNDPVETDELFVVENKKSKTCGKKREVFEIEHDDIQTLFDEARRNNFDIKGGVKFYERRTQEKIIHQIPPKNLMAGIPAVNRRLKQIQKRRK